MKGRFFVSILFILILAVVATGSVYAFDAPAFPQCSSPATIGGSPLASYSSGTHGIPGDPTTHTGSDKVFAIDSTNKVLQCFCDSTGNGIQTNWIAAGGMSDPDIKSLISQGWIYIPDGSAWGLSSQPYLAQNVSFICGGNGGGNGGGLSSGGGSSSGGSSSSNSSSSNPSGGQILGASTSNLAFTGSIGGIIELFSIGMMSFSIGYVLLGKRK